MTKTLNATELTSLLADARMFQAELSRVQACEAADRELDQKRATALRKAVVSNGFVWVKPDFSDREIDLLYGMASEAARIALARRSAAFQAAYGITINCENVEFNRAERVERGE